MYYPYNLTYVSNFVSPKGEKQNEMKTTITKEAIFKLEIVISNN